MIFLPFLFVWFCLTALQNRIIFRPYSVCHEFIVCLVGFFFIFNFESSMPLNRCTGPVSFCLINYLFYYFTIFIALFLLNPPSPPLYHFAPTSFVPKTFLLSNLETTKMIDRWWNIWKQNEIFHRMHHRNMHTHTHCVSESTDISIDIFLNNTKSKT